MRIYIDFDNTLVDTTKAFVQWYNIVYNANVNSDDVVNYDFNPQIDMRKELVSEVFTTDLFYQLLRPYKDVISCLARLKAMGNELYLVSNCSDASAMQKIKWLTLHKEINNKFDGKIFLSICKPFDKSTIDMSNSVLIDDHRENHSGSNAKYKFAYKDNPNRLWYPTYDNDRVIVKDKWTDIVNEIENIVCQNNIK